MLKSAGKPMVETQNNEIVKATPLCNIKIRYRRILIKLFEPHGFQEYRTNEPNVCLKPENLFMCRIGKKISKKILDRFKWLRFGFTPWTWS
jgi:hypothetical protein